MRGFIFHAGICGFMFSLVILNTSVGYASHGLEMEVLIEDYKGIYGFSMKDPGTVLHPLCHGVVAS